MQKNLFLKFIIMIIVLCLPLIGQEDNPFNTQWECGIEDNPEFDQIDLNQLGGMYITSTGVLKSLVVFVQFSDDSDPNNDWPPQQPPTFMNNMIDNDVNQNSTNYYNFTNFFSQMSLGLFEMIGEAKHAILPNTQQWYVSNGFNRRSLIREVLIQIDPQVNYTEYDNWGSTSNYNHINEPDGVADMIFVVFRNTDVLGWYWAGEASLGYGSSYTVENGNITIKTGFGLNYGSGVTVLYKSNFANYFFTAARHEFAHWLLGGPHPHNGSSENNWWGLLGDGRCANAFDRERLGWINTIEVDEDLSAPLPDYITQGIAYKYHPQNGQTNEYYYFENHQKNSIYDDIIVNSDDKGILVLHQKAIYNQTDVLHFPTADGYRDWENPFWVPIPWMPGVNYPAFRPTGWNINGYNHRDILPDSQGGYGWFWVLADEDDNYEWGDFARTKYPFEAAYNTTHNNVFSPASNPNTNTWNNQPTSFAMEVINQNGSVLNVDFYLTDPYEGKPAIPRDLQLKNYNNHPKIYWDENSEPDLKEYIIYKKKGGSSFAPHATIDKAFKFYIDYNESIIVGLPQAFETTVKYKITAVDTDLNESNYSNTVETIVKGKPLEKPIVFGDPENTPETYSLHQNYPNPFNPKTTISFDLPEESFVNLVVYDINGRIVSTLVTEQLSEGSYNAIFDASNFPSGIYIYKITAGSFSQIKRMLLIK